VAAKIAEAGRGLAAAWRRNSLAVHHRDLRASMNAADRESWGTRS
jgi:hypothetical protein